MNLDFSFLEKCFIKDEKESTQSIHLRDCVVLITVIGSYDTAQLSRCADKLSDQVNQTLTEA